MSFKQNLWIFNQDKPFPQITNVSASLDSTAAHTHESLSTIWIILGVQHANNIAEKQYFVGEIMLILNKNSY